MNGDCKRLSYGHLKSRCFSSSKNKLVLISNFQRDTTAHKKLLPQEKRLKKLDEMISNTNNNHRFDDYDAEEAY